MQQKFHLKLTHWLVLLEQRMWHLSCKQQLHFTKYRQAIIIFPILLNFILILSIFSTAYRPGDTTKFTSPKHSKSKCAPGHYVYGVFGNNGTVICNKLLESNFIDVACPSNKYVEAVFTSNHTLRCAPLPESPIRTYNNHYNTTITKVLITANSTEGQELDFSTAPSASAHSGGIKIASGKSTGGRGGDIMIAVGDGDTGVGGDINIKAGKTLADDGTTGGMVCLYQWKGFMPHQTLVAKVVRSILYLVLLPQVDLEVLV